MPTYKVVREIGPGDVPPRPFQMRCLVADCHFASNPIGVWYLDSAEDVGKKHAESSAGHRVVIEELDP